MVNIVYGSDVSLRIKQEIQTNVENLKVNNKRLPKLVVVLVGNNPASLSYIKGKENACNAMGFESQMVNLNEDISEKELLNEVNKLNMDNSVDGILVQMPLPKHINQYNIIEAIDPNKDVDGLHPVNVGKLHLGLDGFVPCTPLGIMEILKEMKCDLKGKNAVVIGRSILVGKPVAALLEKNNCTVTICHSNTKDIELITSRADIVIVSIGKANHIKSNWIKDGAYVVDVGINRVDGKLIGDVDFDDVAHKCCAITPVPKGVGPMTIAMLLSNTYNAYLLHTKGE